MLQLLIPIVNQMMQNGNDALVKATDFDAEEVHRILGEAHAAMLDAGSKVLSNYGINGPKDDRSISGTQGAALNAIFIGGFMNVLSAYQVLNQDDDS